jgi:uncharacterized membrane protein
MMVTVSASATRAAATGRAVAGAATLVSIVTSIPTHTTPAADGLLVLGKRRGVRIIS